MLIPLKLVRDQQLQLQLFDQLRDLIVSHRLLPGLRMPSTRMMAEQFAISRVTVVLAYERLIAEGYLDTRPAAGTFVARPQARHPASRDVVREASTETASPRGASPPTASPEPEARVGSPDPSLFPAGRWRSLMRSALDGPGARFGPEHPAGHPALRTAIAAWLSISRGIAVSPDQIVLTRGRQQAFHLVTHLISHSRSSSIAVEDPCDPGVAAALFSADSELVRIPLDADGMRTDRLPRRDVALIHVTPEHQRPLGVTLSRQRRTDLLAWSDRAGALVLEDDCEGELRYGDMNVPSLMSLDTNGWVILMGGFGVSLGPWLDLTYLVSPRRMVTQVQTARRLIDDSRSGPEQIALAEFLAGGGYGRHLHRLTKEYASRRDALLGALRRHLDVPMRDGPMRDGPMRDGPMRDGPMRDGPAGGMTMGDGPPRIWGQHAGLHVTWFPPAELGSPAHLVALARFCGLEAATPPSRVTPPSRGTGRAAAEHAVLLGFGTLPGRHIETRISRFAAMVRTGSFAVAGTAS
jgi:GntR family transcriptional regulator/MocR family aminotransferase